VNSGDEVTATRAQTTAERAADVLRRQITEGELRPGSQLSEERLTAVMGISRNTLREAFRLLTHDGLLVHRLHRGVFVTELDEGDLVDVYRLRRVVECQVVRSLTDVDPVALEPLRVEVEAAESAAAQGRWDDVGTANMRFHQALSGLASSRRIDDVTRRLLAELRLVFHVVAQPKQLHERYIRRNRALYELLAEGRTERAADELDDYLHESEQQLLEAYRHRLDGAAPSGPGKGRG
jgi:DNA-binding GntR family transcriptional regulator